MTDTTVSAPTPARIGRITLDLDRLVADGRLAAEEAARLAQLGDNSPFRRTLANVFLIFGALMVVAGVLALEPPIDVGLGLALGATALGSVLVFRTRAEWGLLGQALVLMGILGTSGWIGLRFGDLPAPFPGLIWPAIAALTLAGAIAYRNAVLSALAPIALGSMLGGGTEYWHACYGLFMQEPTISLLVFGAMAAAIFALRDRIPASHEMVGKVMARTSFFLANFGFWIGSLWGDYPGEFWSRPGDPFSYDHTWRQTALFLPAEVFAVGWAVALVAALFVGIRTKKRFIANTSIVFLAIHLYTQIFETLLDTPLSLVIGGGMLIGLGVVTVKFDGWLRGKIEARG